MKDHRWFSALYRLGRLVSGISPPRRKPRRGTLLWCERLEERITLDANSAGPNGINAVALGLTGQGIYIGQTEPGRPGLRPFDNNANSHPDVTPGAVFFRDGAAVANTDVDAHATGVAGVMIGNGAVANRGVARLANLQSSADRTVFGQPEQSLLAMQHVATQNNDDVVGINLSWGDQPRKGESIDGNSLLSRGTDYLAVKHDALYVVGPSNRAGGRDQLPADAYNVLDVTAAQTVGGVFRRVSTPAVVDDNGRRLTDLIAPGQAISVPEPTANGMGAYNPRSGTSFAAPHATGTIALLQQDARARGLGAAAEFQEVQKAILINSADKVEGRIGMDRTVLKRNGKDTWDNSDARDDPGNQQGRTLPLDDEMGFGFLDASRADTQLRGGRFAPNVNADPIGWDYRTINGNGNINKYLLPRLRGGSWISITLTWDRQVDLQKAKGNNTAGLYQVNDTFVNPQLADLDLYLMPAGANNLNQNIWSSVSVNYNLETIFYHLPADSASYEIWVRQFGATGAGYGLAWWSEAAPPPKPDKIGDKVWNDSNGNGIQDAGEPGIENVVVQLYSSTGSLLDTTTTDYYGNYSFEVDPGTYYVKFTAPYGMSFTTQYAGTDTTLDSNANASGQTDPFTITSGDDLTIDAGLVSLPYGSIGDYVWNDTNGNGIQDSGEPGIAGVEADLYTSDGTYVTATTTDSSGHYQFTDVAPGNYYVQFIAPANYAFSLEHQGSDTTLDSDASSSGQTDTFSLALGQSRTDIDAGLVVNGGSIGDFVWEDINHNGIQDSGEPGIPDVPVNLYTSSGSLVGSTSTDSDGYYSFTSVAPGSYYITVGAPAGYAFTTEHAGSDPTLDSDVNSSGQSDTFTVSLGTTNNDIDAGLVSTYDAGVGDFVWNDTNQNGIQDPGEPGLAGINVNLYSSSGTLLDSTTTDGTGHYLFTGLDPGSYYITFTAPPGFAFSPQYQGGNPALDSDANASGQTNTFTLTAGQIDNDIDAGMYASSSGAAIGDFVWNDTNRNGIQDPGEPGLSGVEVDLYSSTGALLGSTTTDGTGHYLFSGLAPGTYYLGFVAPSGFTFSPENQGGNTALDSDADATGSTGAVSVTANQMRTDIDAGLYSTSSSGASVGDFVWNDTNRNGIQDSGEFGLGGIGVSLYSSGGTLLASTATDGSGHYTFGGLASGSYYLVFMAPAGFTFSPEHQGTNTALDSDANASGQTDVFTLGTGQTRTDIDAGLYGSFSGSGTFQGAAAREFATGSGSGSGSGFAAATPDGGTAWGSVPGVAFGGSGSGSGTGPTAPPAGSQPAQDPSLVNALTLLSPAPVGPRSAPPAVPADPGPVPAAPTVPPGAAVPLGGSGVGDPAAIDSFFASHSPPLSGPDTLADVLATEGPDKGFGT